MNKFFLTIGLAMCSLGMWAYDAEVDGIYYNLNKDTKTAAVTFEEEDVYRSYSGTVTIPGTIVWEDVTYNVTEIGEMAFEDCDEMTSVTIPGSVTTIGESAFGACSGLKSITIPASVTSIGDMAFGSCTGLRTFIDYAPQPQTISTDVFADVTIGNILLYVPETSIDLYRNADVWKGFKYVEKEPYITRSLYDVNGDGLVNMADMSLLIEVLLGRQPDKTIKILNE